MKRLSAIAATLLLAGCMTFDVKENHFFQPGPAEHPVPIAAPGADVEPLDLTTADGVHLAGARVTTPAAGVEVVYFGGNVSRIDEDGAEIARAIVPMRANVTFFDYRGYGRSGGTPTIEALKNDAVAIVQSVRQRAGNRPVIVQGFSLGSFIAAHVAATAPIDGLVLESTAPDVESWAKNQVPAYAKPFIRLRIAPALLTESTERALQTYSGPLLLMTGASDNVTPPKFADRLAAGARSKDKRVVIVRGATHGTAMLSPEGLREYAAFLDSVRGHAAVAHLRGGSDFESFFGAMAR